MGSASTLSWVILGLILIGVYVVMLYIKGRRKLSIFPLEIGINILYRDESATAFTQRGLSEKFGGASGVFSVIVTDQELWIKCPVLLAGMAQRGVVITRADLDNVSIGKTDKKKNQVDINIGQEGESDKKITITTRDPDTFVRALKRKIKPDLVD